MRLLAAVIAGWLLVNPITVGTTEASWANPAVPRCATLAAVATRTTADMTASRSAANPSDASAARKWFAAEGNKLAASTTGYLPTDAAAPDAKPEIGDITQVSTWSKSMLKGAFSPQNALQRINMWISPVTQGGSILGVVVYTGSDQGLYPVAVPKNSTLAPRVTEGTPEPTVKPGDTRNSWGAVEPKNSHLPVKTVPPGAAYILPDLARALINGARNSQRVAVPIYDPVVDAWFVLTDDQLVAVSATARARLSGSASLGQVREAIQSWWGTAPVTRAPEALEAAVTPAPTAIWVVVAAFLGAGLVAMLIFVALQRQAKAYEEVVPLEDTELIIVPPPPPTTAVPTITVSAAEALTH